jgi:hypothetical protein
MRENEETTGKIRAVIDTAHAVAMGLQTQLSKRRGRETGSGEKIIVALNITRNGTKE